MKITSFMFNCSTKDATSKDRSTEIEKKNASSMYSSCASSLCAFICNCSNSIEESSEQQTSEEGMFYCSLCELEASRSIFGIRKN